MQEIWKPIEGYEDKYMISNLGRVKSLNYKQTGKEKILEPCKDGGTYLYVHLCLNGKCKNYHIHRLVGKAFLPNPDNLKEINHKDENKENNCIENLEWCTHKYNACYGTRNEKVSKALSKKVCCYKDNKLIKVYNSIKDTEKDGFKPQHVCACCKGKYKSHLGFQFKYI